MLKSKIRSLLTKIVSEKRADNLVNELFDEMDKVDKDKLSDEETNNEVEDEKITDGNEETNNDGIVSDIDDWLSDKEEEAEEYMEEDDGPVTSLDDMDDFIEDKKDQIDEKDLSDSE